MGSLKEHFTDEVNRFTSHYGEKEINGVCRCSYDSRSGSPEQALLDLELVNEICSKYKITPMESIFPATKIED